MDYKNAIKLANHLKAIGTQEVYLDDGDKPWNLVTDCEPGGSHRLEISTDVWFKAFEPKTGLRFRWNFEIEPYNANGKGSYEIDTEGCRDVMRLLNGESREKFRRYLSACAIKVRAKAKEWDQITRRQFADADALDRLSQVSL